MHSPINIVCADWSKKPGKRAAWEIRANTASVAPSAVADLTLDSLIRYCQKLTGPVILGIDAAIGVPQHVVDRFRRDKNMPEAGFFDWITWLFEHGQPDRPCSYPEDWYYGRPFIHIPGGAGSKQTFPQNGIGLQRKLDINLRANSPLIVSGLPGTVGSGSRALWRALTKQDRETRAQIAVWPFDGPMRALLTSGKPVVAEIYPKACYGIALASHLPTSLMTISKTKRPSRLAAIEQLQHAIRDRLEINQIDLCIDGEDDFDAMIAAVALHRLLTTNQVPLDDGPVNLAEGDILGRTAIL